MLLTIHNLPSTYAHYADVKSMLQDKCGLTELILDNLVSEGATKRVTVRLAHEGDADILARKINGLNINGLQLYVEGNKKKKGFNQPYWSSTSFAQESWYHEPVNPHCMMRGAMPAMMRNYNMGGRFMPPQMMPNQNMPYMGYSGGGFRMARPPFGPRPPGPPRREQWFGGFQGEGNSRSDSTKRAVELRRKNFTPKANENFRGKPIKKPKKPKKQETKILSKLKEQNIKPSKLTHIMNRDHARRSQAAARLAREVMITKTGKMKDPDNAAVLKELKRCIRARIDALLGEELHSSNEGVMAKYRLKYPVRDDVEFFQSIRDKVDKEEMENGTETNTDSAKMETSETQVKGNDEDEKSNESLEADDEEDDKKPKDDKEQPPTTCQTERNLLPQIAFTKRDHYRMDPLTDKVVDEELDKLIEIFFSECGDPTDPKEKTICNQIKKQSVDEFEQVTRLQLAKRILDIPVGLAIRIYSTVKLPKRIHVKEYLRPYKVKRLVQKRNKRGPMHVAHLANFEDFDRLCRMQNDVIAGKPVSIGSMYLLGPPPNLSRVQIKKRKEQFIKSQLGLKMKEIGPTDTQIELTNSPIESTSVTQQIEDPKNSLDTENMDFAADDFGADLVEHPNIADTVDVNIADIDEEDLEDY